jgi:hypothetical protein
MGATKTCPSLPECIIKDNRCLRHQWYSGTRLSHLAQEFLLELDLIDIPDEVLDDFINAKLENRAAERKESGAGTRI